MAGLTSSKIETMTIDIMPALASQSSVRELALMHARAHTHTHTHTTHSDNFSALAKPG